MSACCVHGWMNGSPVNLALPRCVEVGFCSFSREMFGTKTQQSIGIVLEISNAENRTDERCLKMQDRIVSRLSVCLGGTM